MDAEERAKQILIREEKITALTAEQAKLRAGEDVEPEPKYRPGYWKGRRIRGMSPEQGKQTIEEIWGDGE